MKKFAQAVRAYVKACEFKPSHFYAHLNAAKCYYKIEDYNNALTYGNRAEKINPDIGDLQKLLGDIYDSQKDYESATRSYKRALEIDSSNPEIMTSLAVAYLRTNRNEPARDLLKSVVQIQPDNNKAYKHLGYCYLLLKDLDESIRSYKKAIDADDNDWDARRGLGVAYIMKGKREDGTVDERAKQDAIEQWRKSLEINPDQPRREKLLKLVEHYSK
jgi:tetratricopeptide (TPR) repeat protein